MKNSKTLQNLMNSFAGESQARQRYTMYASIARKEGWSNIASVFEETAGNEYHHGKIFYKLICEMVGEENMPVETLVTGSYPIAMKSTYDNLMYAAGGENEEVDMYADFAKTAREEGFSTVAMKYDLISKIEGGHSERYTKIAELLKAEKMVSREEKTFWKCDVCGYIHYGKKAPVDCPVCNHPQGHFEKFELTI